MDALNNTFNNIKFPINVLVNNKIHKISLLIFETSSGVIEINNLKLMNICLN